MARTQADYDTMLLDKYWFGDDCWLFDGCLDKNGYGIVQQAGRTLKAHRVMYELLVGPIPEGADIHHLCHEPSCARPKHLQTAAKDDHGRRHNPNVAKTHCPKNHPYDETNTKIKIDAKGRPHRACRECIRADALRRYYSSRRSD